MDLRSVVRTSIAGSGGRQQGYAAMRWARVAYLLLAALLLSTGVVVCAGCGGKGGNEKPAVAIQGTIVFASGHEGSEKTGMYSDIYLLDAQGARVIADHGGINWANPVWSPDGTQIAYITDEHQLAIINRDGSGGAYLTPNVSDGSLWPWYPEWLPDGNISFEAAEQIAVLRPDGSGVRVLRPENSMDGSFAWSPDGTQIVLGGSPLLAPEVFVLDPQSGESRTLLAPPRPFYAFDWSPDGTMIVAGNWTGGQADMDDSLDDLFVFDANGEGLQALAQPGSESNPAWSPDGKMIVYQSFTENSEGSGHGLWVMNADGSGAQLLLSFGSQPDWTAH